MSDRLHLLLALGFVSEYAHGLNMVPRLASVAVYQYQHSCSQSSFFSGSPLFYGVGRVGPKAQSGPLQPQLLCPWMRPRL